MEREPTTVPIVQPTNDIEAMGYASLLREHGIDCLIVRFHDTSLGVAIDHGRPWGELRVVPEVAAQAELLISEWQAGTPLDETSSF